MQVDLSGRRAIVTGAASGIGRAIAEGLAASGARVLLADLSDDGRAVAAGLPGCDFERADVASARRR